jgi:hypothetical protein
MQRRLRFGVKLGISVHASLGFRYDEAQIRCQLLRLPSSESVMLPFLPDVN